MYFIGIDISKFKHDCAVIDSQGEVVTPSWSFLNTYEGFASLRQLLTSLKGEKRIGFESTGHYGHFFTIFFIPLIILCNHVFSSLSYKIL